MLNKPTLPCPDNFSKYNGPGRSATELEGTPALCSDEEEPKTYAITVERQITQTHTFETEAENADEARELAEDEIHNIDPDDWDADLETAEPEIRKVVELSDAYEPDEADTAD